MQRKWYTTSWGGKFLQQKNGQLLARQGSQLVNNGMATLLKNAIFIAHFLLNKRT
jgi:hypothetical protein